MDDFPTWLARHRDACDMRVEEIPWGESEEWLFDEGRLRHRSGGFFGVVGTTVRRGGERVAGLDRPLIDQPEVGILGFLLRDGEAGAELLVQAKPEPGNIGIVQAAPTVQATESNYLRRHLGKETPHLGYFRDRAQGTVLSDSLQSEQGTRFLAKVNRNVVVRVDGEGPEVDDAAYQWFPVRDFLPRLTADFEVNTDARSVLVTTPWSLLAPGGLPFPGDDDFSRLLRRSHACPDASAESPLRSLLDRLDRVRRRVSFRTEVVGLHDLDGWIFSEAGVDPRLGDDFRVRHYRVETTKREVGRWDQPLVAADGVGEVVLLCQERNGVLHFLFDARSEPGFREKVQFGPTVISPDDGADLLDPEGERLRERLEAVISRSETVVSCLHSDEGGRFFRCVSRYSIVRADARESIGDGDRLAWMTLGQVEALCARPGLFTNEARSAVSMLLAFL